MRRLGSNTTLAQDISDTHLCHTFTADKARLTFVRLFVDPVQGGGDYVAYITLQRLGDAAEFYIVPLTVTPVDAGYGAISLTTVAIPINTGDVLRTYLKGRPLDGSVTITTEVWEDDSNFYNTAPGDYPTGSLGNAIARLGTSPTIRVQVPLMDASSLELVSGDDYDDAHGRGLIFSSEQWPDLTGAAVTFSTRQLAVVGSVTGPQQVMVELTAAQTALLQSGYFSLIAEFPDGDVTSLITKARLVILTNVEPQ